MQAKKRGYAHVTDGLGEHLSETDLLERWAAGDAHVEGTAFSGLAPSDVDASGAKYENVAFRSCLFDHVDCDLTRTSFVRTPLAGIDLSSCRIGGFTVSSDYHELKGLIIDESQALDLIGYPGIRIKGYDA